MTLGKRLACLACSIKATEDEDEVAITKPLDSVDVEVTKTTGVDVVVQKLLVNEEGDEIASVDNADDALTNK